MSFPREALNKLMEDYKHFVEENKRGIQRAIEQAEATQPAGGGAGSGTSEPGSTGTEAKGTAGQ